MARYVGQLTVGALRRLLDGVPDDYVIATEGCDCIGPSDGIQVDHDSKDVVIERNGGLEEDHGTDPAS